MLLSFGKRQDGVRGSLWSIHWFAYLKAMGISRQSLAVCSVMILWRPEAAEAEAEGQLQPCTGIIKLQAWPCEAGNTCSSTVGLERQPGIQCIIYVEHTLLYQSLAISHMPRTRTLHEKCSLGDSGWLFPECLLARLMLIPIHFSLLGHRSNFRDLVSSSARGHRLPGLRPGLRYSDNSDNGIACWFTSWNYGAGSIRLKTIVIPSPLYNQFIEMLLLSSLCITPEANINTIKAY